MAEARRGGLVLFLGAGSSKSFGYPTTPEIFTNLWDCLEGRRNFPPGYPHPDIGEKLSDDDLIPIEKYLADPETGDWIRQSALDLEVLFGDGWRKELKRGLCRLMPGLGREGATLPSIIEVLSIIDHLLATHDISAPMFQYRFLEDARIRLEHGILKVLGGPDGAGIPPERRDSLRQLASWLWEDALSSCGPVTIISTNYDILLEMEIYGPGGAMGVDPQIHEQVDFGFPWRDPGGDGAIRHTPAEPRLRIFKLHGSLNWLRCPLCGYTFIQSEGAIFEHSTRKELLNCNCCWCGHGALRPVIVAPSAVRQIQDANLLMIWQRALEALRTAASWYIIGYSLPPEDLAIRSILMRAYRARGSSGPPTVSVVEWSGLAEPGREAQRRAQEGRYRLMFPDCRFNYEEITGFVAKGPPSGDFDWPPPKGASSDEAPGCASSDKETGRGPRASGVNRPSRRSPP